MIDDRDEDVSGIWGHGWTNALGLAVGDRVLSSNGGVMTVVANTDDKRPEGVVVYNFAVEDKHTYFVNDDVGDGWAWVHNTCVYVSKNAKGIQYVGITDNPLARAGAHRRLKGIEIETLPGTLDFSRRQARAIEQVLLFKQGLKTNTNLLNKINSIAPKNLKNFKTELQWAISWLKSNHPGLVP